MTIKDTYKTVAQMCKGELFKDKNSKFYGYTFPVNSEKDIKLHLDTLKKEHHSARHWCYAYQLGYGNNLKYRVNDDGEPSNSAGQPIYGQIQAFNLTNVLIVVIRYYGGVKLGVGGLINAYRTGAKLALENALIIEKTINKNFKLKFEYKNMSKVMRILKDYDVEIANRILNENCLLEISVRKSNASKIFRLFSQFYGVQIIEL
ncbi:YigZ family protein [uncultured Winogradskyella sp.]|uniref:IMPACT family protein n=1 Tax=uncultured Winogradskyella sp. TaxID=395353 RepID=UPI00261B32E7|nr:YigZ family protein [uncultured Winogradskyella sp.]